MALFTPSESPAVVVKEVDLTGGVPNVQSSTGAIVGNYRWGPVEQRVKVNNEANLIDTFGTPDTVNTIDFHNAAYFLRYSNSLQVVRMLDSSAKNSLSPIAKVGANLDSASAATIKNKADFDASRGALDSDRHTFIGRFPGALGNSLRVSICPPGDSASVFTNWAYASEFSARPSTSGYDNARDASKTEIHVAVVDNDGLFTGTKGSVLERYPFVSVASNSKKSDGSSNYVKDLINERSEYVYMVNFDSAYSAANAGTPLTPGTAKGYLDSNLGFTSATNYDLQDGVNSGALNTAQIQNGFDFFADTEQVEIDFLICPGMQTRDDQATVVNDAISTVRNERARDAIAVTSPARSDVIGLTNETTITNNIVSTSEQISGSSYRFMDGNYLKVYDKFNDQFIEIPAASSTAGIMASTDRAAAPWFSPAGAKRGQYFGVTTLNYNPNKSNRDTLYKAQVNPVINSTGDGVILFGDKTGRSRPSAFDRVNVRRLFLVLERAIARAAKNVLFEFNDEFTRAEFVNVIEPVLRDVKGRRGITDFRVVADETVNTPAVVDRNEFIANIFIKPARSINYVTLNFVAVRTGVEFEEVTGTV